MRISSVCKSFKETKRYTQKKTESLPSELAQEQAGAGNSSSRKIAEVFAAPPGKLGKFMPSEITLPS